MKTLDDAIERIKQPVLRGHIRGARAVLEMLLCAPLSGDICRRRSFLSFDHALIMLMLLAANVALK